jgi:antitoxin (DNA-binding transcriptional repressor) of toxin-antitoxin stability system
MQTIGTQDVAKNFAALLQQVKAGEEFVVMEDGATVARIVPCASEQAEAVAWERHRQAVQNLLNFQRVPLEGITIRELIDEGRKY